MLESVVLLLLRLMVARMRRFRMPPEELCVGKICLYSSETAWLGVEPVSFCDSWPYVLLVLPASGWESSASGHSDHDVALYPSSSSASFVEAVAVDAVRGHELELRCF